MLLKSSSTSGMERPQFVRHHGVLRLPPGFRFHPTDEELLVQYLRRKVFSFPLPAAVIPEIDLANHDPWDLPGPYYYYFFLLIFISLRIDLKYHSFTYLRAYLGGGDEAEEEERYFFNLRQSNCVKKGNRSAWPTRSGYWKATGKDRPVAASRPDRTVGTKRAFAFYLGKPRRGSRTDWFMHEYSLSADEIRAFTMCHAKNATLHNIVRFSNLN